MSTKLFIAVNPVGSKFAKALQAGLVKQGIKTLRCSPQRGVVHRNKGRKVFFVTQQTKDKIAQFNAFQAAGVSCPAFTTSNQQLDSLGSGTIFARTLTNSTNGKGIVEFSWPNQAPPSAPLYTAYIPKKIEYRAHVFNGKVIDIQQKKKKKDFDDSTRNTRIRNLSNGYVYTRDNVVPPEGFADLAIAAVQAVGYNYGAVDIIYNEKQNKLYVLEVNSRPGLMGTTLDRYVEALKELV